MAISSVLGRAAGSVTVATLALCSGASVGSTPPPLSAHLDSPPPGVTLGTVPTTAALRAAAAIDRFAGGTSGRVSGGVSAAATAVVPAGKPGIPTLAQHLSPSCTGTGTDGNRVQVVYAVESGRPDRYSTLLPEMQSWVADVDDTVGVSAAKTGGARRVRWVHGDCVPVIRHEVLPAGSLTGGLGPTITALKNLGYTSAARKYLVFADDASMCGIGQIYADSTKTGNANDGRYTMFARVDSSCWPFAAGWHSTAAHELMHTLGAVQDDAPNSTKAGHCRDETDAMCYADGGLLGTMLSVCAKAEELFDCRDDDYFSTAPTAGSYLASHWNPADSSFLDDTGSAPAPTPPPAPAPAASVAIGGGASLRAGLSGTYTATGTAGDASYTWSAAPAACVPGGRTSPTVVVVCPSSYTGSITLSLAASTPGGPDAQASRTIALTTSPKATMTTALGASPATVAKGASTTLTARVTAGAAPVRATVTLFEKTTTGTYKALTSAQDTGADGLYAWKVAPTRNTTYAMRVTYAGAGGWNTPAQATTAVRLG